MINAPSPDSFETPPISLSAVLGPLSAMRHTARRLNSDPDTQPDKTSTQAAEKSVFPLFEPLLLGFCHDFWKFFALCG